MKRATIDRESPMSSVAFEGWIVSEKRGNVPSGGVRVLVALPQRLFLDGVCSALSAVDDLIVVAESTDRTRIRQLVRTSRPEVAVLDYRFANQGRLSPAYALEEDGIGSVILCPSDVDAFPDASRSPGARELVLFEESFEVLIEAVRRVASRPSDAPKSTSPKTRTSDVEASSALTSREILVLRLLAKGFSTKEIAAKLNVAVRTVENYRSRLAKKLDIHSTAGLTRYAIRARIVDP